MRVVRIIAALALSFVVAGVAGPGCSNQDAGQPPMGSIDAPKGDFGFPGKDQDKGKGAPRLPVSGK